jgi:hypothetical protein
LKKRRHPSPKRATPLMHSTWLTSEARLQPVLYCQLQTLAERGKGSGCLGWPATTHATHATHTGAVRLMQRCRQCSAALARLPHLPAAHCRRLLRCV